MLPSIFNLRVPIAGQRRRVSHEHVERRTACWCPLTWRTCSSAHDFDKPRRHRAGEDLDLADGGTGTFVPRRRGDRAPSTPTSTR